LEPRSMAASKVSFFMRGSGVGDAMQSSNVH